MKKHILFLGLLLIVFGLQIDAQTLKNIHRHNQPMLRIPTHLIDKVETAEVNGAQVLQVHQLNGYVSEIPLAQIDSITHSEGEAVDPAQLGNLRTASVMGVVSGPTGAPEMNAIVRSPYGGEETRTDPNGVFFLNNILVYDKLGYITITKPGFHQGSRSFLPLETGSNRVNVQLLPMTLSGTFSAATGGSVTSGLLQLTFPANTIQLNGQPYTGTVNVFAEALDPTSTTMFDQMPGELLGGLNDSLRLLRSFGMASVELRDTNMNELQLATGVSATLAFNIPASLQAEAPATIDWWSFEENLGYWKHEGEAQKQGTQYIGHATHFSWWNCDVPENFNNIHGTVNSVGGTPVSDAQVNVVSPTMGTGVTFTNAEGDFSGRVPKNQQIALNIYLTCETTNDWTLAFTEDIVSNTQPIYGEYEPESLDEKYLITGNVVNCTGMPVEAGYVKMGPRIFPTRQGEFLIQSCEIGSNSIRCYDISNLDSVKVSDLLTFEIDSSGANLGELTTCSTMHGSVSDIDGNVYATVLIGEQWWMTENLRTSRFSDGTLIPNVTDNSTWIQLLTPGRCNFNNVEGNDILLGKLYNWYTTTDTSNLCPTGWHVPTWDEWTELTYYLGLNNTGGKMKSLTSWNFPNKGATNESGFSAFPQALRDPDTGEFSTLGGVTGFWSSTYAYSAHAWCRVLQSVTGGAINVSHKMKGGMSVRCIKN